MKRSTILFIASIVFYAACIAGFIVGRKFIYNIVWLLFGFGFLFIARQEKKKEDSGGNDKTQQ